MSRRSLDKHVWSFVCLLNTVLVNVFLCAAAINIGVFAAEEEFAEADQGWEARADLVKQWQQRLSDDEYGIREQATEELIERGAEQIDLLVELCVCEDLEAVYRARAATIAVYSQLSTEGRIALLSQLQTRLAASVQLPVSRKNEMQKLIASLRVKAEEAIRILAQRGVEFEMSPDRTIKVGFRANVIASEPLFAEMCFAGPVTTINLMRLRITDDQLRYLKRLQHLERLYLKDTGLTGTGLKHLTALANLHSISLQGLKLKPEAFAALAEMKNLQYLGLDQTNTTDEDLAKLSGLTHIRQLWLNETKVSDQGLAALESFDRLEKLVLTGLAIDGSGLAKLAELKDLKYLSLEGCPVGDSIMPQLRRFEGLETLGLDNTHVTDKAVAEIKEMQNLKVLWLAGSRITDNCVPDLLEMQNLERLLLFNCHISQRELQRLQDGLPNCKINDLK